MTTEDKLRAFILRELRADSTDRELTDDYPIIEQAVIDSLGIFEIVAFIESEFGVAVDDEDLVIDNFGTIRDIAKLVHAKLPA